MTPPVCVHCGAPQKPRGDFEPWHCDACRGLLFAATSGDCIVVAHGEDEALLHVGGLLCRGGWDPVCVKSGDAALRDLERHQSSLLLIDAALDDGLAFRTIGELRDKDWGRPVKVLLLMTAHSPTAYRRAPRHLHGADDYLEMHALDTSLIAKVGHLMGVPGHAADPSRRAP